jgi:hypothetical protein
MMGFPMSRPASWRAEAHNPVPDSENRIHSDDVARKHGFEGALVPGVTVSAYLCHPAVEAWGVEWLARGRASIVVKKPVYDGRAIRVDVRTDGDRAYDAELSDAAGTLCAIGRIEIPAELPPAPRRRGDDVVTGDRVPPTREGIERLRDRGMGAVRVVWGKGSSMASYLRDADSLPELLRLDRGGYANTSFVLGLTNWVFAANVALGPWLHLETQSQHFAPIAKDSEVVVEAQVVDLFEKKGHAFVDVEIAAFLAEDVPALTARLRAIYRLRGA